MTVWISLLRGINVGGRHIVRMTELVARLEAVGCEDVKTYIQSGNAVFRSKEKKADTLAMRIGKAIAEAHGFEPHVLMLTRADLEGAARANPFAEGETEPKSLHLFFLDAAPRKPDLASLETVKLKSERFAIVGRVFYLHAPDGIARSKLVERVGPALGVPMTARNWRTVGKLIEMARELS